MSGSHRLSRRCGPTKRFRGVGVKLGFGLYRHMLDDAHFAFARQCGATHVVVHLCDYFAGRDAGRGDQPVGDDGGWGVAQGRLWTRQELIEPARRDGAAWARIPRDREFRPRDVGPHPVRRAEAGRADGRAATPDRRRGRGRRAGCSATISGLAGVAGRVTTHEARGGAPSVGLAGRNAVTEAPMPAGMAWNMTVDPDATGLRATVPGETLWERLGWFLERMLPAAEAAGVVMAAHPDDPPLRYGAGAAAAGLAARAVSATARPLAEPRHTRSNSASARWRRWPTATCTKPLERHARAGRIGYVHLRNVRGPGAALPRDVHR